MKRFFAILLITSLLLPIAYAAPAAPEISAPSAVLMDKSTGTVLYQKNPHEKLPPASVTKVMTLLLVMEALDAGKISIDDMVTVSADAASMGGSQVYLETGEQMSLHDMLKATVISSGNDSAVALAEHVAGSEEGFVELMNARAKELAMNDTHFVNCTGLDADGHLTSAHDIAIMSCELLKHDRIKEYSTTWMDTLRGGAFQLSNTNKLLKTYKGITGLKTGSTSLAKYCMAASAERDGMEIVASIMAAPSTKDRFSSASALLDYGFANYAVYDACEGVELKSVEVLLGTQCDVSTKLSGNSKLLLEKDEIGAIKKEIILPENVKAPVAANQSLGILKVTKGEETIAEIPIVASVSVPKQSIAYIFRNFLSVCLMQ